MTSTTSGRVRPATATIVAGLALSAALGSGSYAAGVLTGKDVKNGSLTGKDLKNESLTGKDVKDLTGADLDMSSLGVVPNAHLANLARTAETVGYVEPDEILTTTGCQPGKVRGFARVRGNSGSMPNTFTTSASFVDSQYNCSGSSLVVRRISAGHYRVKFTGNPAFVASAQVRTDVEGGDHDVCATVNKVTADGPDKSSFDVLTTICGADTVQDADFSLVVT